MKKGFYYIISIVALSLLFSCSTKKNTKASRFYHAFNSRYNIYFNGKTSFDETLKIMEDSYRESYTDMIYFHPISAQPKDKMDPGGPFDRAIEKGNKAIKLHSIKTKPPKKPGWRNNPKQVALQAQEEYNPFLKKCWLLTGQGQFYNADFLQAAATFSYIARHYAHDEEVVAEAKLWQARCYAEMDWLFESEDILKKLNINGIPQNQLKLYAKVYADYLIKNGEFEEAAPYLQTAIKGEKSKLQRSRMKYLLGQMYADQGIDGLAYKSFGDVIRSNPPYELEFAARIRQTEVFPGNNYEKVIRMLERMGRNERNKDYLDQVYYALGNIYLSREDTVKAIQQYESAIEKSTQNGMDKAICQIKLGDLYFGMCNYVKAQPCFSGAISIINREYKEYKRISKLSSVLDELVIHVEAVQLQDSLQTLARMPEEERLAVIDKIIEQVIKEEEEAKALAEKEAYLAEQEALGTGIDRPGTDVGGITIPTAGGSSFYFYNTQAVAQGKTQFQRKWGRRTLEDDWRRRNKTMTTFLMEEPEEIDMDNPTLQFAEDGTPLTPEGFPEATPSGLSDDPKTRDYYIQQLPLTEEDMVASNLIIIDGLYHMGMIYKDKLEDIPLSIETFEELNRRFPNNENQLESYYQLYLMALYMGDTALASRYKNNLIASFPDSDYAIAISDPDYEQNIRMMDSVQESLYQLTYNHYLAGDIHTVRNNHIEITAKYPLARLIPKFMFLDALTYVQEGNAEGFKEALKALVEKYPDADVTELAGEMLKGVLRGRTMVQGNVKGMAWNLRLGMGDGELSAADSARTFTAVANTSYKLLLIYPSGSIENNQLLFAVAAYNFGNFMVKEFDLTIEEAGPMTLLMINGFVSLEEILQYSRMIYSTDGYASAFTRELTILPISEDNYETLMRGKTLEEYIEFFEEQFGELAPEMVERWRTHMEEEDLEEETEEERSHPEETIQPATTGPEEEIIPESPVIGKEDEENIPVEIPDVPVDTDIEAIAEEPAGVVADTISVIVPVPVEEKVLTLKDIEDIRRREAEEEEARREEARKALEAKQQAEKELQARREKEREELLQQQKEEAALLKAKAEREKQLQADRKQKLKQAEAERKAKLKAREQLRKQKEREYKERQKQKEKERKEKEREYKEKIKQREKERREAQKAREAAAKKR